MTGSDLILIDTNVLIYAFDKEDKRRNKIALSLINALLLDRNLCLSNQNLAEFVYVTTKKIKDKLPYDTAKKVVENMLKTANIISYNEKTVLCAIDFCLEFHLHFWDALIIATMIENNVLKIYTENSKDFLKCNKVEIINPFEKIG